MHLHAGGAAAAADARALGTSEFLRELGKVGGFKADVTPFYHRWVGGRGCPHLAAAFVFNRCGWYLLGYVCQNSRGLMQRVCSPLRTLVRAYLAGARTDAPGRRCKQQKRLQHARDARLVGLQGDSWMWRSC
jgi:hypothetical protein